MLKDPDKKKERGYVEPGSFVRLDDSEVLKGGDWNVRKDELWKRCKGRCEYYIYIGLIGRPGVRCPQEAQDPHHIKPRSKGRDDRLSNLQALCRYHHNLLDERKIGGRK